MSTDFTDPGLRLAADRNALFRDLIAALPAGPWEVWEEPAGWTVGSGRPLAAVATGLTEGAAGALATAGTMVPRVLGYWEQALGAAQAVARIAVEAGADPLAVSFALAGAAPGDPGGQDLPSKGDGFTQV